MEKPSVGENAKNSEKNDTLSNVAASQHPAGNEDIATDSHVTLSSPPKPSDEDDSPIVALKDLEEKSLREMARERKRVIENQVVRRKVINQWLADEEQGKEQQQQQQQCQQQQSAEKTNNGCKKKNKLHAIQKHWHNMTAKLKSGGSKTSFGQKNCTLKSEEELIRRNGKYRMTSELDLITFEAELNALPTKQLPGDANNNPRTQTDERIANNGNAPETMNGNLAATEEALLVQIGGGKMYGTENGGIVQNGISSQEVDDDSLVLNNTSQSPATSLRDRSEGTPHDSLETPGHSSITMTSNMETVEIVEETEVLQTDSIKESVEITISGGESITNGQVAEKPQKVGKNVVHNNPIGESVIEREIRLQKEREEALAQEKRQVGIKKETATMVTAQSKKIQNESSSEVVFAESNVVVQSKRNSTSESNGMVIQAKKTDSSESTEKKMAVTSSEVKTSSVGSEVFRSTLVMAERSEMTTSSVSVKKTEKKTFVEQQTAESKIAMEIREMREREEELKKMREKMVVSNGTCSSPEQGNGHIRSDSSVKSDDSQDLEVLNGVESPQPPELTPRTFRDHKDITRAVSLDSLNLGQSYNIGYVFAHRRKENIKVRPFTDEDEDVEEKPNFKVLQESPVERDIRLAKEREEELRKEKALLVQAKNNANVQQAKPIVIGPKDITLTVSNNIKDLNVNVSTNKDPAVNGSTIKELTLNGSKDLEMPLHVEINGNHSPSMNGHRESIGSEKTSPKFGNSTQKQLATTRIQQEIEEQTRREMALRASGQIQTISQERTDAKVTRLGSASPSASDVTSPTPKLSPNDGLLSPDASESKSISSSITNGHGPAKVNGSVRPPSSATSSSSSSSKPVGGTALRRLSNPPPGKNVSMQRFIASKGKEIAFSNGCTKSTVVGCFDYHEIKPPQVRKGDTMTQKRSVTAETKIQEELKEMKAREEELKKQRARLLGLSQPNLSTLADDEDLTVNGSDPGGESTPMERCSSNPNLLDTDDVTDCVSEQDIPVGGPRRRSILIDQWEQRIKKLDVKS